MDVWQNENFFKLRIVSLKNRIMNILKMHIKLKYLEELKNINIGIDQFRMSYFCDKCSNNKNGYKLLTLVFLPEIYQHMYKIIIYDMLSMNTSHNNKFYGI